MAEPRKLKRTAWLWQNSGLAAEFHKETMDQVVHDLELLEIAGNPFTRDRFLQGEVTPVFFGSALTNFGVESFRCVCGVGAEPQCPTG
ncbi:MAG: hypothetical protein MRJ68_12255 [Nitrospira sp.]|nr:hypothetical protein [Nitrospira sp.]